ncbi:unnamed protein product [Rotaria sordida]|uniref:Taste receptor type 2 n=1 Tax=Rotaria sordida TaxID=392033 RepID=A0A815NFP0_9BILA|nr:unnamed protein product [Rotaria sordida]CAF3944386.1 unnamed protein product [Rotaria sordida]
MTSKRVILGFIGNILGLFVFWSSRRTWQVSSAYVYLATSCSITNLLCVIRYVSLLHSRFRNILYELVGQIWWACKVYEFAFSFRVISAWITLFWMFERLMCVSKKLRACFNKCNSYQLKFIIPILLILTILSCVIGPPVYMFEPQILDYIIYHVVRISRRLHQTNARQPRKEQWRTKLWMNIVLVLHSLLFLSSLLAHIVGHFIPIEAHEAWWVLLAILFNCSLNFYVYCLSGKAFRNEIYLFIQRFKRRFFHRQHIHQHQRQQCRRSWNLS